MTNPTPPSPASIPDHLRRPPEEDFWLRELGFAAYTRMAGQLTNAEQVEKEVVGRYVGKARDPFTALLKAAGDDAPTVRQHLWLVAEYIEDLKTAAIIDVAKATLGASAVEPFREGRTRWARLPLAMLSYVEDPRTLLSVAMCDRWHALGRCVMKVLGRVPVGRSLTTQRVRDAAVAGLPSWRGSWDNRKDVTLLQVFQRGEDEVLVGFRRPFNLSSLLDKGGGRLVGHTEEWVVLRYCQGGHRVDVTAKRLVDAVELAAAVGRDLLGVGVHYTKRRDPVTETVLGQFLERLCHPDAEDLVLVEIKAEMPGEPGRPVKTISGSGQEGIEQTVAREADRTAFAEDWKTVHHVKVWYEGYRFTIHFPTPGEVPLALSYSDLGRDKGIAEAFEDFVEALRDELGADIAVRPRSEDPDHARTPRRRKVPEAERVPARLVLGHWRRMFGTVIDDPALWEMAHLDTFRRDGLLSWRTAWFFRCGDVRTNRFSMGASARTLGCPGQVEWENESNQQDPYADLPDKRIECPDCGHEWKIGDYRPPLHRKLYIEVHHDRAWQIIFDKANKAMKDLTIEVPGIASGLRRGTRLYLAYLPLVDAAAALARVKGHPVLWCGGVADPGFCGVNSVTCDLAQLHAGKATLEGLLDEAVKVTSDAPMPGKPTPTALRSSKAGGGRSTALSSPPPFGRVTKVGYKTKFHAYATQADMDAGKPSDTWDILAGNAVGCRLFISLLAAAAAADDMAGRERQHRDAEAFKGLYPALRSALDAQDFYRWAKRARECADRVATGVGELLIEGGEGNSGGDGYRLGARYQVSDFQIDREIQIWKSHGKNKAKS
ncbi:MAG: hypothetical protein ABIO70_22560 [Pseudomonadota bacterium]